MERIVWVGGHRSEGKSMSEGRDQALGKRKSTAGKDAMGKTEKNLFIRAVRKSALPSDVTRSQFETAQCQNY